MLTTADREETYETLQDPALFAQLHRLRQTDNVTNWRYFLRVYLFLAVVLGTAGLALESLVRAEAAIESAL